jgi:hypothetical protein
MAFLECVETLHVTSLHLFMGMFIYIFSIGIFDRVFTLWVVSSAHNYFNWGGMGFSVGGRVGFSVGVGWVFRLGWDGFFGWGGAGL